jgi:type II secretory pathway component GspD/PulD (secretin)
VTFHTSVGCSRKTLDKTDKQELLIFITPRIIQDSLTTR